MISYRHHIVSLVAVFLALAVGIVLGGGPLSDLGRDDKAAAATPHQQKVVDRTAQFGDQFATASATALYDGRLRGHAVSIVAMPGADGDAVSALTAQVKAAGGSVAGTFTAKAALTDASQKALVDSLGAQLMTQLSGAVDSGASTYVRMGQILGLAVATTNLSATDVRAVRQSLAGADLVGSPADASVGQLVLVVLGSTVDPAIVSGLTTGLAAKATGVVVTGDTAAGAAGGDLTALRADTGAARVATVDGDESALGQVSATLALIRSLTTQGGSFGASGSDGAVPLT